MSEHSQSRGTEVPRTYEPQAIEPKWYSFWEQNGCFAADPARVSDQRPAYSIVIPPPNVTGVLTLGHVLNNTIQDILARRARMLGKEVLWLPGTDHAGIATQNVVEKTLRKDGTIKHRDDLGREALVEKIWEWKEKYGGIILQQLRALGASCDWSRTRFTMDERYSECVSRVFVDLYKKGLIYRGKRMVNWCPASLTALSDEEVEMKEQNGTLYYFKVEVVEEPGRFLTIATTRPETIPGDSAIAVNPKDPRYVNLIGKHARRPLPRENQAELPIIGDDHVAFDFGTGVLKVTPAHDKADFEIWTRIRREGIRRDDEELRNLEAIDIMHPNGVMNDLAGADLAGLERFAARKKAVELLTEMGALEKEEPYKNSVGYSERAQVPIEPRLSEQWFLKYPSVDKARTCVSQESNTTGSARAPRAVEGAPPSNPPPQPGEAPESAREGTRAPQMHFYPERWAKVYDHWMEGIQDWCVSRQLWWGHRVPVWRLRESGDGFQETKLPFAPGKISISSDLQDSGAFDYSLSGQEGHSTSFRQFRLLGTTSSIFAATISPIEAQELESLGFEQDPDVLDTWFSSWLWPFATMGWPEKTETLAKFYPTTDLVTGPDIIFFWVARMIMAGYEYMGELPFRNVYFTGIIRDKNGDKMSKSKGNSPDPLVLIDKYGADAVRLGIMRSAPLGQDLTFEDREFDRYKKEQRYDFASIPWNPGRFPQLELGRNFCTKLWNAARLRQMHGGATEGEINPRLLTADDKWILMKLDAAIREVSQALDEYRFSDATTALYRFFWSEFCDWYLEAAKAALGRLAAEGEAPIPSTPVRDNTLAVLDFILAQTLRLFHPFLPFITEELWQGMGFHGDLPADQGGTTIMNAHWPKPFTNDEYHYFDLDPSAMEFAEDRYAVVNAGRGLRRDFNIGSSKRVRFVLRSPGGLAPHDHEVLQILLNAEPLELVDPSWQAPKGTPVVLTGLGELFLPLEGLVDAQAERTRIGKEIAKVQSELEKVRVKLADQNFAAKVPAAVLDEHRQREATWSEKLKHLESVISSLGD